MCTGIALSSDALPLSLTALPTLRDRLHDRAGHREYQFHWWQRPCLLPVRRNGRLELLPWGCRDRSGALPYGGWVALDHAEAGGLGAARPERVVIPACLGFHRGTWFLIDEGVHGLVILTPRGPVAYMLIRPSTNYYRNMTAQTPMMPALVGQVI